MHVTFILNAFFIHYMAPPTPKQNYFLIKIWKCCSHPILKYHNILSLRDTMKQKKDNQGQGRQKQNFKYQMFGNFYVTNSYLFLKTISLLSTGYHSLTFKLGNSMQLRPNSLTWLWVPPTKIPAPYSPVMPKHSSKGQGCFAWFLSMLKTLNLYSCSTIYFSFL